MISYSVAIRTLGTAGEKYRKLLNSIRKLQPQPERVVVVLPEGYKEPEERLGFEEFVYSPKGMVAQRLESLKYIDSEYILFCDDDVSFGADFVKKLEEPLRTGDYSCSAGPLLEFFPPGSIKYLIASLLGGACVMLRGRQDTYARILNTGGWSYNRSINLHKHKIYQTDSLPWTCFFIKKTALERIHFEDEMWCERSGYAAFEDRVMFYKLKINGFHTCVVSDAAYIHNDARSSTSGTNLIPQYARAFNHFVFWHRFLYMNSKNPLDRIWKKICISYYISMQKIYTSRNKEIRNVTVQGFTDAKQFIKTSEYQSMPSIRVEQEIR